ncbi:MAG: hypothetical protein OQL16_00135 [Gammaproteobacteria bacterium]|nr:hypothetical protein [Gammaproteobacteria bacterium]
MPASHAACPAGTQFQVRNNVNQNIRRSDLANSAGSYTVVMDFSAPMGSIPLDLSNDSFDYSETVISTTEREWRLRVRRNTGPIEISDLTVTYVVTGLNGVADVLSSPINPASQAPVTLTPASITKGTQGQFFNFEGFIQLDVDLSTLLVPGSHSGTIAITVDCF